jgi:transposase
MRAQKERVKDIARQLDVSIDAVERWLRAYRGRGIDGIRARKPSGRPAQKRKPAEARMKELLKQDPQAFGLMKGRWVVRDMAKALSADGIKVSRSYVHDILKELGHGRVRGRDLDQALPTRRSQVVEEGGAGEGAHSRLQHGEERLRDALLAQEVRVRLEQALCHKTKNVMRFIRDRPESEKATEEGPKAESHRMAREQTTEVGGLLEQVLKEHGRGRQQYGPFHQTT